MKGSETPSFQPDLPNTGTNPAPSEGQGKVTQSQSLFYTVCVCEMDWWCVKFPVILYKTQRIYPKRRKPCFAFQLINSCAVLQPQPLLGKGVLFTFRACQSHSGGEGVCVGEGRGCDSTASLPFFQPLAILKNTWIQIAESQWAAGQKEPLFFMWSMWAPI